MKKSLFLMALASVAMASCVSDEIADVRQTEVEKGVKVKFDAPVLYNNVNSRANVYGEIGQNQTNRTYPTNEKFVVFAVEYAKGTPFTAWNATGVDQAKFSGSSVSYAGESIDGWAPTYTTQDKDGNDVVNYYYWPSGKQMAFAAYSPADLENATSVTPTYSDAGLLISNFTIPEEGKQYDLLFSERVVDKTASSMTSNANDYSGIKLQFQHALSSVRFSFMNHTNANVVLLGVKLKSVKNNGTFAENITTNSGSTYVRGSNVNPSWTLGSSITEYVAFDGELEFPYNARYVSDLSYTDAEKTVLVDAVKECNQLLLMPQPLAAVTAENKNEVNEILLEVTYKVNDQQNTKTVSLNNRMSIESEEGKGDAVLVNEWKMGHRYTYRIVYSPESAQQDMIYFAPSTDQFKDVNVVVVELI